MCVEVVIQEVHVQIYVYISAWSSSASSSSQFFIELLTAIESKTLGFKQMMCTFWLKVKHDMIKVVQFLRFKLILHLKYQLEVKKKATNYWEWQEL